ncbi:MAG TPA: hypothetical protein DDW52_19675 [Planctomycetaceae bacterium]|nr:hypothetical protein [Planctomycetaceae bacterium]
MTAMERHNVRQLTDRRGFNALELLVVVVIISSLLWLILPVISGTTSPPPPEHHVRRALNHLQMALLSCVAETGSAPRTVGDLPQLLDKYVDTRPDRSDLLGHIITTGKDSWGNPIQIRPIKEFRGRYTIRSLGPDGVLDNSDTGDDIVVSYTAGLHDASSADGPANKSVNRSGESVGI